MNVSEQTFEQWRASSAVHYEVLMDESGGDVERVKRTFDGMQTVLQSRQRAADKRNAEWLALQDLCGKQLFITLGMRNGESVGPTQIALARALAKADPSKHDIE